DALALLGDEARSTCRAIARSNESPTGAGSGRRLSVSSAVIVNHLAVRSPPGRLTRRSIALSFCPRRRLGPLGYVTGGKQSRSSQECAATSSFLEMFHSISNFFHSAREVFGPTFVLLRELRIEGLFGSPLSGDWSLLWLSADLPGNLDLCSASCDLEFVT